MARPIKQGIDYFPLDVGFFSDVKIRKISRACGASSASILICLLCNIYKDNGYYILWDEDLPFVIADTVGVSEGAVKEVLLKALQVEFFSKGMYEKYKILTSEGIQKRFLLATYQRKETVITPDYLINCTNNAVNCMNNSVNCTESTQSKVKVKRSKTKENPSKEGQKKGEEKPKGNDSAKKLNAAKAATLSRKDEFYKSLIPYVDKYPKEMIRAFFDYWSEMNKSETKMRFEKQPTWEVGKRLATWANKETFNGNNKNTSVPKSGKINSDKDSGNKPDTDTAGFKELINTVRIG